MTGAGATRGVACEVAGAEEAGAGAEVAGGLPKEKPPAGGAAKEGVEVPGAAPVEVVAAPGAGEAGFGGREPPPKLNPPPVLVGVAAPKLGPEADCEVDGGANENPAALEGAGAALVVGVLLPEFPPPNNPPPEAGAALGAEGLAPNRFPLPPPNRFAGG